MMGDVSCVKSQVSLSLNPEGRILYSCVFYGVIKYPNRGLFLAIGSLGMRPRDSPWPGTMPALLSIRAPWFYVLKLHLL